VTQRGPRRQQTHARRRPTKSDTWTTTVTLALLRGLVRLATHTQHSNATLKRYTQTLHKAQDSVIGGMAEYEIEDRRVRREQKIRLVNV
jgi:hypothetical protein